MLRNGRVRRDGGTARPTGLGQAASGSGSAGLSGCLRWWAYGVKADSGAMGLWKGLRPLRCLVSEGLRPLCALCAGLGTKGLHTRSESGDLVHVGGSPAGAREAKGGTQTHTLNEKGGILGAAMPKAVSFTLSTPSAHLCWAGLLYYGVPDPTGSAA